MRVAPLALILATAIALPAMAQTKAAEPPAATITVAPSPAALTLTADQAKAWVDKPVYGSDDKKIGEVAAFARGTDNVVQEMHADIGGFLGLGETRVKLTPAQFKLSGDRVIINMTSAQAKDLPKVSK